MLFVLVMSVYYLFVISKVLPDEVKYRYEVTTRFKAIFLNARHWENEIEDKDISYFKAFNKSNRSYTKLMLFSFIAIGVSRQL